MDTIYFTICSANYLHYARALHESLVSKAGSPPFVLFLVDEIKGRFNVSDLGFECIEIKDIGCDYVFDMAARYSIMEMNTAIKPFCFKWLFRNRAENRAVYLDPDIYVLSELREVDEAFDNGANAVLTPHSLAPLVDGMDPDDVRLMRTGAYNLGFAALRRSTESDSLLDWWGGQLLERCVVDLENGLFVDQKFFDLVPCYFSGVSILRHPGHNVAYWNLTHRKVTLDERSGIWTVNDVPLRFFHFSGVVPSDPRVFSKHQNRFDIHNIGDVRILLGEYLDALNSNMSLNGVKLPSLPYAYATMSNGLAFTDEMRRVYGDLYESAPRSYADAFNSDLGKFLTIHPRHAHQPDAPLTRLIQTIWEKRADVRETFPIALSEGRTGLISWFLDAAAREHRLPAAVVEATRRMYDEGAVLSSASAICGALLAPALQADEQSATRSRWLGMRELVHEDVGIGMIGYFTAENGLGSAARQNFRALQKADAKVSGYYLPCPGFSEVVVPEFEVHTTTPKEDCLVIHVNADSVGLVESYFDPAALRQKHKIGYWAWELESLPIEWLSAYRKVDEIWTPSAFCAEAFAQRTDKPVIVVPHSIDVPRKPADLRAIRHQLGIPTDRFVFLTAFDLNSYIDRKNPDAVVEAFGKAFEQRADSPLLVVKLHGNYHRNARYAELMEAISRNRNIMLIDGVFSNAQISDLQWCCDAFVSLHRSEGFGLWIAECMARSKPCIVTNYSGNVDFTDKSNSLPIGYSMISVKRGQYPHGEGQWWADPNLEEAISAMRKIASDSTTAQRLGSAAREHILTNLSPERIGQTMHERVYQARAELLSLPSFRIVP